MSKPTFELVEGSDARKEPVRLLVVQGETRAAVEAQDEPTVMTFPHLVVLELLVAVAFLSFLVLISVLFDAPLEELANPLKTPNPAKAPWYFLGLQELLHYYPPLISGVVLPGIVVTALAIIPYFDINLRREPLWQDRRGTKALALIVAIAIICVLFYVTGAHPVWPLIGSTLFVGALMLLPAVAGSGSGWRRWLATRSLPFWIFTWFVVSTVVLTVIGVFFRGPAWSFVVPWIDGVYY